MISLSNIEKSYGDRTLFSGVNGLISVEDRIGLVGPNGSGKSTLLEILAGRLEPDQGVIGRNRRATVGYLLQEVPKFGGRTLLNELLAGHENLNRIESQLRLLEEEMRTTEEQVEIERLTALHGDLEHRFQQEGGYDLPAEASKILGGLGFPESDFHRGTDEFSGGWLMRLALAKLLLVEPSLLLLDEPTNYLDLESVVWLEGYLRSYEGSIVVVSHDRALLNNLPEKIWEIDGQRIISYTGNYDAYLRARALREEGLEAQRKAQARFLKKEQRFIERFRYKNTKAKAVQSRIKRLEKMDIPPELRRDKTVRLTLPPSPPSVRMQVVLRGVHKSYNHNVVYESIDFDLQRGDRVALVGPNGAGKSTFMKIIGGSLAIDRGMREVGRGVEFGYFAQHQVETLDLQATLLEEVASAASGMSTQQVRTLLGRFLFSGDDAFKKISVLSGGEKSRVAFAKLLVRPPNVILLDEPTSHLDIRSCEVLEEALREYEGSLIIISHDRRFLDGVATRVLEVGGKGLKEYLGGHSDYLRKKEEERAEADHSGQQESSGSQATSGGAPGGGRKTKEERRKEAEARNALYRQIGPLRRSLEKLEGEIEALESDLEATEEKMADPEFYQDGDGFQATFREYSDRKAVLESKTELWESISLEIEKLTADDDQGVQPG